MKQFYCINGHTFDHPKHISLAYEFAEADDIEVCPVCGTETFEPKKEVKKEPVKEFGTIDEEAFERTKALKDYSDAFKNPLETLKSLDGMTKYMGAVNQLIYGRNPYKK
jgi:hypothetical protein